MPENLTPDEMHRRVCKMVAPYLEVSSEAIAWVEFDWQRDYGFKIQARLRDGREIGYVSEGYRW